MHPIATATIRTMVPYVVGWLVVSLGIDPETSEAFLTALFGSLYYVAVRVIAEKVPAAGWLLGVNKAPEYR